MLWKCGTVQYNTVFGIYAVLCSHMEWEVLKIWYCCPFMKLFIVRESFRANRYRIIIVRKHQRQYCISTFIAEYTAIHKTTQMYTLLPVSQELCTSLIGVLNYSKQVEWKMSRALSQHIQWLSDTAAKKMSDKPFVII